MLYLSHLRLAKSPSVRALAPLLQPVDQGLRRSAQHNLLWSVFSDGPDRSRDFLWREERDGSFLTLSQRPPVPSELFEPHRVQDFAPALSPGDRLLFQLRCNATRQKPGAEGKRVDVVMDALYALPKAKRAEQRMDMAAREGQAWMQRQGVQAGFELLECGAEDYTAEVLAGHRGPRKGQPQFGILELAGVLEITDPALFLPRLAQGFGRAKAFGCGLMLIRRAR